MVSNNNILKKRKINPIKLIIVIQFLIVDRFAHYTENQIMTVLYLLHDMFNHGSLDGLDILVSYFARTKIYALENNNTNQKQCQEIAKKLFRDEVELVAMRYSRYKQMIVNNNNDATTTTTTSPRHATTTATTSP